MITSASNAKLKYVRRLLSDRRFRTRERVFVIEGVRWLEEVAAANLEPTLFIATADWVQSEAQAPLLAQLKSDPILVASKLIKDIADTTTPVGFLAVVPQPEIPWPSAPNLLLVLDAIRDPGNLGTILRTAAAAGVDGVLLAPRCVDLYNPKVVRSSMGSLLRLPVLRVDWSEIEGVVAKTAVYLADAKSELLYAAVNWREPATLIVGGEAHGASVEAKALAQQQISIPMLRATESINAAVAASIILFEAVRQKTG